MFRSHALKTLLILISLLMVPEAAFSAENATLEIVAVPGKPVCQSKEQMRGGLSMKAELCVTQGEFSHDTYQFKINGNVILKGIDDDTTRGISSTYNGESVQLVCTPKNEAPTDVSPEKVAAVQKIMPKLSHEEAVKTAILMETAEVGRSCVVRLGNDSIIEALVKFE